MKIFKFPFLIGLLIIIISCSKSFQEYGPENQLIRYQGRIDFSNPFEPILIGSASYVEFGFQGDSCTFLLKNLNSSENYGFISLEVDGEYRGRAKIVADTMVSFNVVAANSLSVHRVKIFKATEASNGSIAFGGVKAIALDQLPALPKRKIEFIGNSITCGMGIDWKEIPCHTGPWYDQHNAYLAYGPQSAMDLNAQFLLSSVSGIGIYRNWNTPGPTMSEVYENMYLNTDDSKRWDFLNYTPDLVSICLGTNDFSNGDGTSERLPFDSVQYVNGYIDFVETIYLHYPETQVCLLTSPMIDGEKARLFERCVTAVKNHFAEVATDKKKIAVYFFEDLPPHGCDSHPDKEDQREMANRLIPFYKEVMEW